MSLIPFLDVLCDNVGSEIGVKGFVIIDGLPPVREQYVVSHVLADRGEVDASGDAQPREFGWVANSGEHEELWGIENSRAQNNLFAGGHLPPLTFCHVSERRCAIELIDVLQGSVPNSTPLNLGMVPRSVASRSFVAWA